ncbi:hypothetical protein DVH24_014165 [Malus domestica]|uniref:Uncharacterized protein n=1 Tax=Malus domestica TaxID=3750 RepID=A0A498JCQ4_MALDO|nr:hypothetical protein DVH24_014165 [Malus domestica]
MGMLPDFPTPTADQLAIAQPMAQPANLVDQLIQNPVIEEPVVYPALADSGVVVPLSNPKTTIVPFILDEEMMTTSRVLWLDALAQVGNRVRLLSL